MKDAYSFDIDEAGLDESYRKHEEVYRASLRAVAGVPGGGGRLPVRWAERARRSSWSRPSGRGFDRKLVVGLTRQTWRRPPRSSHRSRTSRRPETDCRSLCIRPAKASIADVTRLLGIQSSQDIKCVAFMGEVMYDDRDFGERPV